MPIKLTAGSNAMSGGQLIEYYSKRASEYERIYQKPERQKDLLSLREHLRSLLSGHEILEIACGTGYWTQAIAEVASSIVATDASKEVLEVARSKGIDPGKVSFVRADAYNIAPVTGRFSAGLAGFWWSHVPLSKLREFIDQFHAALLPGARLVFLDNRFVAGSSTPLHRTDREGNTYQLRRLADGSTHEVLKNFPSVNELRATVQHHVATVEVREFDHYWCMTYVLKEK